MRDNKFFYCKKPGVKIELPRTDCLFTDSQNFADWCTNENQLHYESFVIDGIKENRLGVFDFSKNFIDIGGAMGAYTVGLGNLFNHTYTFEPNKKSYYLIHANCILNDIVEKVDIYNVFLSDRNKTVKYNGWCSNDNNDEIGIDSSKLTSICLEKYDAEHLIVCDNYQEIQTKTLDEYNFENVGFIKIDTEGHDFEILKGSVSTILKNNYPIIEYEVWDCGFKDKSTYVVDKEKYENRKNELDNFLFDMGYFIFYNIFEDTNLAIHETHPNIDYAIEKFKEQGTL